MKFFLSAIALMLTLESVQGKKIIYPEQNNMPVLFDGSKIPEVKPVSGNYLYMAETEVSNQQYHNFLEWLKLNDPEQLKDMQLDTGVWGKGFEPFKTHYFQHEAYANMPVVGISQLQAKAYCQWLHDRLEAQFRLLKLPVLEFVVRLPSEQEWMMAARGGQSKDAVYPWPHDGVRFIGPPQKHKGKFLLNCRMGIMSYESQAPYNLFATTEVYSYWPNGYGLYNMSGNVAEWLEASGTAKGGSWKLPPYNCRITQKAEVLTPFKTRDDIGFRYVVEIVRVEDDSKTAPFEFHRNGLTYTGFNYIPKSSSNASISYMSDEIDNLWYRQFLLENKDSMHAMVSGIWKPYFRYSWFEQYAWHSAYNDYPVVGIRYTSALAFCQWLTEKYARIKKPQYKKVQFRLPTEAEWMYAAQGGESSSYPWGGGYIRNSKGCYLANFAPLDEKYLFQDSNYKIEWYHAGGSAQNYMADGAYIPSKTLSYFPNNYGLSNCSGNVAEMTAEEGVCKGGSWLSDQFGIMISSREKYNAPNAALGFRVIAEVLEQ